MNRRLADRLAVAGLALVLVAGLASAWQAYRRFQALDGMMGEMMGGSMAGTMGVNPVWYVVGTLVAVVVLGAAYVAVRDDLTTVPGSRDAVEEAVASSSVVAAEADAVDASPGATDPGARDPGRLLNLLPEDERRVLQPVVDSPGLTQIELRDRSDFSKSKVSQTVSDLEQRGLLYRERQGRTYRVYPDESLVEG